MRTVAVRGAGWLWVAAGQLLMAEFWWAWLLWRLWPDLSVHATSAIAFPLALIAVSMLTAFTADVWSDRRNGPAPPFSAARHVLHGVAIQASFIALAAATWLICVAFRVPRELVLPLAGFGGLTATYLVGRMLTAGEAVGRRGPPR